MNVRRATGACAAVRRRGGGVGPWGATAVAIALLVPSGVHAGLDLAWNGCAASGGVSHATLSCGNAGTPLSLYATISTPYTIPGFVAMEAYFDVWADGGTLPPFWQFDTPVSTGACNAGYVFSDALGSGECPGTATPWGTSPPGAEADAIVGFAPFAGGQLDRGRFVAFLFRPFGNPTTLAAGAQTFAFRLDLYPDAAIEGGGACTGCTTPVVFVFREVRLYVAGGGPVIITDPGILSNCATIGSGGSVGCWTRAVQNRTWGALKSIYR